MSTMTSLKNALYNSLLRKEEICCLCFNGVGQNAIRMEDVVVLNINDISYNIEIFEVLCVVIGKDVADSAIETICKQCAKSALNCYTFIKKCKENSQKLQQAVDSLDNCLQNTTGQIDKQFYKSLFISLDENFTAQDYYDFKRPILTLSVALKRFNSIMNKQQYYLQEIKHDDDCEAKVELPEIKQEIPKFKHKNKKRRSATLPKEMILHKDSKALAYKCKDCLKIFQAVDYLRQHYLRVHAPKTIKCEQCDRSYGSLTLLEQHIKDCHETKVCVECGKVYNNRYSLKQHEIGHRLRFICQKCGRVYKNKDTFKQHITFGICGQTTRKAASEGLFKCDICNKQYSRKTTLSVHIKCEHSEAGNRHVCSWCNKRFSCQSRLKAHTVKHTQEKNFSCDICGGKFVTKESLKYHTRIHTGEKPYGCPICDQRFLSASRRIDHVRRHHTESSLECDICKAKYNKQSHLLRHKQRHADPQSRLFKENTGNDEEKLIMETD